MRFIIKHYSPLGQSYCIEIHVFSFDNERQFTTLQAKHKEYYFLFNRNDPISLAFFISTVEYIPH